jgi:hypothetical protein
MQSFMRGPSVNLSDDDDDGIVDLHSSTFKIPTTGGYSAPPTGGSGPNLGTDMLINRRKVSNEVMSLSSSSPAQSEYSESEAGSPHRIQKTESNMNKDYDTYAYQQQSSFRKSPLPQHQTQRPQMFAQNTYNNNSESDESSSESDDNVQQSEQDTFGNRFRAERSRLESDMDEKKKSCIKWIVLNRKDTHYHVNFQCNLI